MQSLCVSNNFWLFLLRFSRAWEFDESEHSSSEQKWPRHPTRFDQGNLTEWRPWMTLLIFRWNIVIFWLNYKIYKFNFIKFCLFSKMLVSWKMIKFNNKYWNYIRKFHNFSWFVKIILLKIWYKPKIIVWIFNNLEKLYKKFFYLKIII